MERKNIKETYLYYGLSKSEDENPTAWYPIVPKCILRIKMKVCYLWTYTRIEFTDGSINSTEPELIGLYPIKKFNFFKSIFAK